MASKQSYSRVTSNEDSKVTNKGTEFYLNLKPQSGYDLSIFMVGITGAGKSSFCNFLCNKEVFEEAIGMMSVSKNVSSSKFKFASKEVLIIDSPGFCDSIRSDDEIFNEICRVGVLAKDGTDAIALVVNGTERFSDNHRKAFLMMESMGSSFWEHTFIVFTREWELMTEAEVNSGEEYLQNVTQHPECPPVLTEMLKKTEGRYMFVDSIKYFQNEKYRNEKCTKMLKLITEIRKKNNCQRYNNILMKQGKRFFGEMEKLKAKGKELEKKRIADTRRFEEQIAIMKANEERRYREEEEARKLAELRNRDIEKLIAKQEQMRLEDKLENEKEKMELKMQIMEQKINAIKLENELLAKEKEHEKEKREELEEKHRIEIEEESARLELEYNLREKEKEAQEYKEKVAVEAKKKTWGGWFRSWFSW